MDAEVVAGGEPVSVAPEREVGLGAAGVVVFAREVAAGVGDGVPAIGDDLGAGGQGVGEVQSNPLNSGRPGVPGFDGAGTGDSVSEVVGKPFLELAFCAGMGLGAANDDPVVYDVA